MQIYIFNKNRKIIFISIASLIFTYYIISNNFHNLKVCICTIGKNENLYSREFVEYYKKYGIDKIFIYDNNDIDGEKFEDSLSDYIKKGFVKIINYRGKSKMQYPAFNNCYNKNKQIYNWFIFYDMDEYIHLTNFSNIKAFLGRESFNKCNVIYLNQVIHTDNEQIYYSNKSLFERFPNIYENGKVLTKIILRGNLSNINFTNPHVLNINFQCNSFGKIDHLKKEEIKNEYFYYDHFYFKSSEEYLNKLMRGDAIFGEKRGFKPIWFRVYFSINKISKEKIDFFENKTGMNLSNYRDKLIKYKRIERK